MKISCTILAIAVLGATAARADVQSPEETLRAFYSWVLAHPSRALPSAKERSDLSKTLSPELIQLLNAASDTEAMCVKAAPKGDKPDILEGDLFVGNYEGATEVAYRDRRREVDMVLVDVDLIYVDTRFPKAHPHRAVAWQDRVELRPIDSRWFVQDVRFATDRSLVAGLKSYIEHGARSCGKR